jgi:outer membrane murein-binding lipoprotein Lpp
MADDNVDFRFLGQQVKNLQADVRDLRAGHLRLESDVVGMRSELVRIDERLDGVEQRLDKVEQRLGALDMKIDNHHRANQVQFEQMAQSATTSVQLLLAAISKGSSP